MSQFAWKFHLLSGVLTGCTDLLTDPSRTFRYFPGQSPVSSLPIRNFEHGIGEAVRDDGFAIRGSAIRQDGPAGTPTRARIHASHPGSRNPRFPDSLRIHE